MLAVANFKSGISQVGEEFKGAQKEQKERNLSIYDLLSGHLAAHTASSYVLPVPISAPYGPAVPTRPPHPIGPLLSISTPTDPTFAPEKVPAHSIR